MTDKEFKNLKRRDLVEIIYEYQKREKKLNEEIEDLRQQLTYRDSSENTAAITAAVAQLNQMIELSKKSMNKCCVSRQKRSCDAFSGGKKINGKNRKHN